MGYWVTIFRFMQLFYLLCLMILLFIYTIDVLLNRFDLDVDSLYKEY